MNTLDLLALTWARFYDLEDRGLCDPNISDHVHEAQLRAYYASSELEYQS